jgi:hypothetical protein
MTRELVTVSTTDTPDEMAAAAARHAGTAEGPAVRAPATVQPTAETVAKAAEPRPESPTASAEGTPPAEPETPAAEAKPEKPPEKPPSKSEQRKLRIQTEIDDLTRQRHEVQRALDTEAGRLEGIRQGRAPERPSKKAAPKTPTGPQPEPIIDQFHSYEEWDTAWRKWVVAERDTAITAKVAEARAADHQAAAEDKAKEAYSTDVANFRASMDEARTRHPDFDQLAKENERLPINPDMHERMVRRPLGGEILYHLFQHPEDCVRIASLPPRDCVTELALIEAEIANSLGTASPPATTETPPRGTVPAVPPRTRASEPIEPLGPGAAASAVPLEELAKRGDHAAYRKARLGR